MGPRCGRYPVPRKSSDDRRDREILPLTARLVLTGILAAASLPIGHAARASAGLPVEELHSATPARMSMTYEKGFLFIQVDVLDLDVRFGRESGEVIRELASRRKIDSAIADSIATLAIGSRDALITITFLRNIDLNRFISEARKTTRRVWEHGIIDKDEYDRVYRNLPSWYGSLEERGIRKGDRMFYRIQDDRLHTVFQGEAGNLFVDQVDEGPGPRRAVLGGYFVDGSDFRDPLIRSLVERDGKE